MGCSARSHLPSNKSKGGYQSPSPIDARREVTPAASGALISDASYRLLCSRFGQSSNARGRLNSTLSQHSLARWTRAIGTSSASVSYLQLKLAEKEGGGRRRPPKGANRYGGY
jgi:hypothetical protein